MYKKVQLIAGPKGQLPDKPCRTIMPGDPLSMVRKGLYVGYFLLSELFDVMFASWGFNVPAFLGVATDPSLQLPGKQEHDIPQGFSPGV